MGLAKGGEIVSSVINYMYSHLSNCHPLGRDGVTVNKV